MNTVICLSFYCLKEIFLKLNVCCFQSISFFKVRYLRVIRIAYFSVNFDNFLKNINIYTSNFVSNFSYSKNLTGLSIFNRLVTEAKLFFYSKLIYVVFDCNKRTCICLSIHYLMNILTFLVLNCFVLNNNF